MKRYDQLTTTRFWALLLVLIYHGGAELYISAINRFPVRSILFSAPSAVSYLYVLSGFVMSLVYYRPKEKIDVWSYWTARVVRIYPLYIVSFALTCYYYVEALARIKPQKILANIFVLQAWWPPYAQSFNYASWSMTVEFFFYFIFPFFVMWAYHQSTKKLLWVSMIFWIVSQTIHFVLWVGYFPAQELFIVYNPIFHLNSFIIGVTGGIWFVKQDPEKPVNQKLNFSILLVSLVLMAIYPIISDAYPRLPHNLQPMAGLLAPFFVLFITTLALDKTKLSEIMSKRWLVVLGETSFALYILHVPVVWLMERWLENSGIANPDHVKDIIFLPIMIAIGLIAYLYIDPPIRNWMKNLLKRISLPVLLIDLVIIIASIFISFRFRFGDGREYFSYQSMGRLIFWSAFFFRTAISILATTLDKSFFQKPILHIIRSLAISTGLGSLVVAGIVYAGYSAGWFYNFPRSIFLVDWIIIFSFSFLVRLLFRSSKIYRPESSAK